MTNLQDQLALAPAMAPAHEELAIGLANAPTGSGGVIRSLMRSTGAGFLRVALWVLANPGKVAAIVAEATSGQYGAAFADAVNAIKAALAGQAAS